MTALRERASAHRRRGTIIVAVLVIVALSALAASTTMYFSEAATAGADASLRRVRSRALAWSGIQAVMAELDAQRDQLLDGDAPMLTTQWQLFEEGSRRGIVRLVALEQDDTGLERWAVSESTRLNINLATPEMLGNLGGVSESQAAAIHGGRPYGSLEELVRVAPDLLNEEEQAEPLDPALDSLPARNFLTVMSFDPNVQAGIETAPGRGGDSKGKLRVNLNVSWSDELAEAIRTRFDAAAVNVAKTMFDAGEKFKKTADLVGVLRRNNVPPPSWPPILDTFTVSPDPYIPGRIDVNRAPARVLATIPGISQEAAAAIVQARHGLEASRRRSIAWPVIEGILSPDEFVKAVDWMTTRSMQWRVRLEAGIIDTDSPERGTPELQERMTLEAIIDVASDRPRVAYLRDVTLLSTAFTLKSRIDADAEDLDRLPETAEVPDMPAPTGDPSTGTGLRFNAGLNFNAPPPRTNAPPAPSVGPPSPQPPAAGVDRRIGRWSGQTGAMPTESQP
jgi:DNA uptake protein ComE-like DNA-binding protein